MQRFQNALGQAAQEGVFDIADNFIAQDSFASVYKNITSNNERPEYTKGDLNLETVKRIIRLLTQIQTKYPHILETTGINTYIAKSIAAWRLQVQENVNNKIYNPFTRSYAIRDDNLRSLLAQVCGKDGRVISDLIKIYDLLLEQRHPDGSNSGGFTSAVEWNIKEFLSQHKDLKKMDDEYLLAFAQYGGKELKTELGFFDLDSDLWMDVFCRSALKPENENIFSYFILEAKQSRACTCSQLPEVEIVKYMEFLNTFYHIKKYALRQSWKMTPEDLRKEIHKAYGEYISYEGKERQRKENILQQAKDQAKRVFQGLSPAGKQEYFSKVFDKKRGQHHSSWLHSYREFAGGKIIAVISEQSDWDTRGGIERDSQLSLYTNDCTLSSRTGYNNYRDRFDSKNDNYDNQYTEVLDIQQEGDTYKVKVKTGKGREKIEVLLPNSPYQLDMEKLATVKEVSPADKKLFVQALQQKS